MSMGGQHSKPKPMGMGMGMGGRTLQQRQQAAIDAMHARMHAMAAARRQERMFGGRAHRARYYGSAPDMMDTDMGMDAPPPSMPDESSQGGRLVFDNGSWRVQRD
jgi:hypothetical protein